MTEKRFSYEIEKFKEELGQYNRGGLVRLLLEMKEENEQLKQSNKGLQSELQIFKEDITHSNKIINRLNDENEQLKAINKYLIEILEHSGATVEIEHIKGDVE